MQRNYRWMAVGLIMAGLLLSACGQASSAVAEKPQAAKVTPIEGTELSSVELVPEAAKRLGIQTAPVREEQVSRKRIVGGQVEAMPAAEALPADRQQILIRVSLTAGDMSKVDRARPARILPLALGAETTGVTAKPVTTLGGGNSKDAAPALYYAVDGAKHNFTAGQRVRVELPLAGSTARRRVVPYASVIYGLHGETWVYANSQPLTFVRESITVDYIEGDMAVLSEGPAANTEVVTAGAAELLGTELGVGH